MGASVSGEGRLGEAPTELSCFSDCDKKVKVLRRLASDPASQHLLSRDFQHLLSTDSEREHSTKLSTQTVLTGS